MDNVRIQILPAPRGTAAAARVRRPKVHAKHGAYRRLAANASMRTGSAPSPECRACLSPIAARVRASRSQRQVRQMRAEDIQGDRDALIGS